MNGRPFLLTRTLARIGVLTYSEYALSFKTGGLPVTNIGKGQGNPENPYPERPGRYV
jgi:hypothetical protein